MNTDGRPKGAGPQSYRSIASALRQSDKVQGMPHRSPDELRGTFEHHLRQAVDCGDCRQWSCTGLDSKTWQAIEVVAGEYPNPSDESVAAARHEFERQLDGTDWREQKAVREALDAGLIPLRRPDYPEAVKIKHRYEYSPDFLTIGFADPDATQAWLEAQRENPSGIYRRCVLGEGSP